LNESLRNNNNNNNVSCSASDKNIDSSFKKMRLEGSDTYEGWNFNSGNYLFTTDTK